MESSGVGNPFDVAEAKETPFDFDIFIDAAVFRHGLVRIGAIEGLGFIVDQVGEFFLQFIARLRQFDHFFFGFHRAFFATEPRDVTGGLTVGCFRVDKGPTAVIGAEMTDCRFIVAGHIFKIDPSIEADKGGITATLHHTACFHGGPNGTGLTAVRVDQDFCAGNARLNIVDLGLQRGQVVLGSTLQDKTPT